LGRWGKRARGIKVEHIDLQAIILYITKTAYALPQCGSSVEGAPATGRDLQGVAQLQVQSGGVRRYLLSLLTHVHDHDPVLTQPLQKQFRLDVRDDSEVWTSASHEPCLGRSHIATLTPMTERCRRQYRRHDDG
jgi:hypothetical protein